MLYSQLGSMGQKYVSALFGGDKRNEIDYVYGVYLSDNGTIGDNSISIKTTL